MEKYNLKEKDIKFHNIVFATTSEPDYEMNRWFLLEDLKDLKWDEYVVVEGYHCSCYGFDETNWEAIKYTKDELVKIAKARVKGNAWDGIEKKFYQTILNYIKLDEED